jgi:PAS domain S-box-containing protein
MDPVLSSAVEDANASWDAFLKGLPSGSQVRPLIEDSWTRCRAAGVDPESNRLHRVSPGELDARLHASRQLLAVAPLHLDWISATLAGLAHVLYLTDRDGVVLYSTGTDPETQREAGLVPGYDWSEARMGTNGAGTALACGHPVAVAGQEHFVRAFHGCTCTAAPVRGPDGALVGAVDLSTANVPGVPGRLALAAYVARVIEGELASRHVASVRALETRYQLAMEAGQLGSWEIDLRDRSVVWDERARQIFGHDWKEPFPAERAFAIIHPEDRAVAEEAFAAAISPGSDGAYCIEKRVRCARGDVRWVATRGRVFFEGGSPRTPVRIVGTVADITERREAEAALRTSEERLRRVAESGMIGMLFWELDGPVTYANAHFLDMVGRSREELEAGEIDWRLITPPGWEDVDARAIRELREAGAATPFEKEFLRKDGSRVPVLLSVAAFTGTDRRGVTLVVDMTLRKQAEAELRRLYEEAAEAVRDREEVVAIVGHDLRNPLGTIALASALLVEPGTPQERRVAQGKMIQRSVEQMDRLIQDLLDASLARAGRFRVNRAQVPVSVLLADAVELARPLAAAKAIAIDETGPNERLLALADRDRVLQVFSNLIGNALKFTPEGGRVVLGAEVGESDITFSVADSGPGISADDVPRLFERFWQRDGAASRGVGLGLGIAKGIVEAHGGRIWVDNPPGGGATFSFTLPRSIDEPPR